MNTNRNTNVQVIIAQSDSCVLDTCCCCIPLKTGCLILGYIELVQHIVGALFAQMFVAGGIALLESKTLQPEKEYEVKIGVAIFTIGLVLIGISLLFTIFLLVGLHKDKRNYVKIYLVVGVIMLVLNVIEQIAKFYRGYASGKEAKKAVSEVISILFDIYFLLVLRSQYIKMGISAQNVPTQYYHNGLLMQKV